MKGESITGAKGKQGPPGPPGKITGHQGLCHDCLAHFVTLRHAICFFFYRLKRFSDRLGKLRTKITSP